MKIEFQFHQSLFLRRNSLVLQNKRYKKNGRRHLLSRGRGDCENYSFWPPIVNTYVSRGVSPSYSEPARNDDYEWLPTFEIGKSGSSVEHVAVEKTKIDDCQLEKFVTFPYRSFWYNSSSLIGGVTSTLELAGKLSFFYILIASIL